MRKYGVFLIEASEPETATPELCFDKHGDKALYHDKVDAEERAHELGSMKPLASYAVWSVEPTA